MDTFGAVVLIAGLFWLTRIPFAEIALRNLDQKRELPAEQIAARGRFFDWLAGLPSWPGCALLFFGRMRNLAVDGGRQLELLRFRPHGFELLGRDPDCPTRARGPAAAASRSIASSPGFLFRQNQPQ